MNAKETDWKIRTTGIRLMKAGIVILSVLAVVKSLIIGLEIDEEYAVTLAYRIAMGDKMFLEMWEPHQTSAFLDALFIKGFMLLTGGVDYLVIYLRIVGTLIQLGISVFLYTTLKKFMNRDVVFFLAALFFNTLPKWIQTPEFSNMQIWFCMLTVLCFLRYYSVNGRQRKGLLILAAVCHAAMILSYPSCVIVFPVYLLAMRAVGGKGKETVREMLIFTGVCVVLGLAYVGYFLLGMSLQDFLHGLEQMVNDGAHNGSMLGKFQIYAMECGRILWYLLEAAAAGLLLTVIFMRRALFQNKRKSWGMFLCLTLAFSYVGQMIIWLGESNEVTYPLVYYYGAVIAGIAVYAERKKESSTENVLKEESQYGTEGQQTETAWYQSLFWFGIVGTIAAWFACLCVTNTTCYIMGAHLLPAVICAFAMLWKQIRREFAGKGSGILIGILLLTALCATLFAKGFLIRSTGGFKENIFLTRQKALSGPAKNIYYRYIEGYQYNIEADLWEQYVEEGDCVLYVGRRSIMNMHKPNIMSAPSTISTPTYDENLQTYWKRFPDRYPDVIIIDDTVRYMEDLQQLFELPEPIAEVEDIYVYRLN